MEKITWKSVQKLSGNAVLLIVIAATVAVAYHLIDLSNQDWYVTINAVLPQVLKVLVVFLSIWLWDAVTKSQTIREIMDVEPVSVHHVQKTIRPSTGKLAVAAGFLIGWGFIVAYLLRAT